MDEKDPLKLSALTKTFHESDEELHEHAEKCFTFSKEQKEHAHKVTHHHMK